MAELKIHEKTILQINNLISLLGFSSCKIVGMDQFDGKIYKDQENLITGIVNGSKLLKLYFPYNDIIYNESLNQWLMDCANIEFRVKNNLIPSLNTNYKCYHSLPKFLNIKRSNGDIQKAKIMDNAGLRFRINNDIQEEEEEIGRIYLRVEYDEDSNDIENKTTDDLLYFKDILIQDVIELNPEISNLTIYFDLPKYINYQYNSEKYIVMKHFCDLHYNWEKHVMNPIIKYIISNKYSKTG